MMHTIFEDLDNFFVPSPMFRFATWTPRTRLLALANNADDDSDDEMEKENSCGAIMNSLPAQVGLDVHEDKENYAVSIDLPGVQPSDVHLKLGEDGKTVHLTGSRKRTLRREQGIAEEVFRFSKRFKVGKNVDTEKLTANLSDGVLTLKAPKTIGLEKEIKIVSAVKPAAVEASTSGQDEDPKNIVDEEDENKIIEEPTSDSQKEAKDESTVAAEKEEVNEEQK